MTPIERLQAAIARLTELRDQSTPGPWRVAKNDRRYGTHAIYGELPGQEVVGPTANYGGLWNLTDGELIVTLHRTTPYLLILLQDALRAFESPIGLFMGREERIYAAQLALADAILEAQS